MGKSTLSIVIAGAAAFLLSSCASSPNVEAREEAQHANKRAASSGAARDTARSGFSLFKPKTVTVPEGTPLSVRIHESLSTRSNHSGDRFTATLNSPIVVDGKTVLPAGTQVNGVIRQAAQSGRLKGRAVLTVALDSVETKGEVVSVSTTSNTRVSSNHKKNNWGWIGGTSAAGALLGGLAGGGKGAAIGAGAGAGAGAAGAAITGVKHVTLPAETLMTFRLRQPVTLKG